MDAQRLRAALAAAGWRAGPRELAEVIWLAGHLPATAPTPARSRDPGPSASLPARAPQAPPPETSLPGTGDGQRPIHVDSRPRDDGTTPLPARAVRAPSVPALPSTLDITRALRPLRRRVPATHESEIDEEATVTWYAEHHRWRPVLRPASARALDLALILDGTTTSAAAWSGIADELQSMLGRLAAFRSIRVRHLMPGPDGRLGLAARAGAAPRSPAEVVYPRTRRLVLVLTDCVSTMWGGAEAHAVLAHWARHCAVAILQPLPEHLWGRTSLPPVAGVLRGGGFVEPNTALSFTALDGLPARALPTAVPVLEISADWLRPWAELVAGVASGGIDGVAALVGPGSGGGAPAAEGPPANLSPFDRVLRFRSESTPEAYRLAGLLAAAPLTPSTMRLVQAAMLPRSRPSHLAEVWFSGLLTPMSTSDSEPLYEFADGVRDVLLGTLHRHEIHRVLDEVSRFVESRLDRGAVFTAATPDPDGAVPLSPLSRPFARVQAQALRRLRGEAPAGSPAPIPEPSREPGPAPVRQTPAPDAPVAGSWTARIGGSPPSLADAGSRAVLILGSQPAFEWMGLQAAMRARAGMTPTQVTLVGHLADWATGALPEAAGAARDVLFVSYTGTATPESLATLVAIVASSAAASKVVCLDPGVPVDVEPAGVPDGVTLLACAPAETRSATNELVDMLSDGAPEAGRSITLADLVLRLRSAGLLHGEPRIVPTDMSVILGPNPAFRRTPVSRARTSITSAKIVVAGGFGSGKTTMIGAVSEIEPVTVEAIMTSAGMSVDDNRQVPGKTTITVAGEMGRVTFDEDLVVYLFGTPGTTRFWFEWDDLVRGTIGAVVLLDTRRLADCFAAIDFFEHRRLPYLVAVNAFDGVQYHAAQDVREALAIGPEVPVVVCDARARESVRQVLISLIEYVLTLRRASRDA